MNAKLKPWMGTPQQILIGLVFATLIVAIIEANSDYDDDCGWSFMGNVVSHYGRGDYHKIRIGRGRCRLDVKLRGDVDFTPDNQGIAHLEPGASLEITQRLRRERRRLDVEPGSDGQPEYTWYVNRLPKDFDDEGRAWLAEVLPRIYRTTGLDADGRVAQLWAAGGFDEVLREIQEITSSSVRATYLRELLKLCTDDGELVRALELGRREISSDHELAKVLTTVAPESLNSEPVREAWMAGAEAINSDWELHRVLSAALNGGDLETETLDALLSAAGTMGADHEQARFLIEVAKQLSPEQVLPPSYFRALESIGSDHEHKRTLSVALGKAGLTEAEATELLATSQQISSDFELAGLLREFAQRYPADRNLPKPFFEAVETIDSDSALRQVLSSVVEHRDLDPETAVALLDSARAVSSDFELSAFLVQFLDVYPKEEPLPQELERLIDNLDSDFERDKVRKALETREPRGA